MTHFSHFSTFDFTEFVNDKIEWNDSDAMMEKWACETYTTIRIVGQIDHIHHNKSKFHGHRRVMEWIDEGKPLNQSYLKRTIPISQSSFQLNSDACKGGLSLCTLYDAFVFAFVSSSFLFCWQWLCTFFRFFISCYICSTNRKLIKKINNGGNKRFRLYKRVFIALMETHNYVDGFK